MTDSIKTATERSLTGKITLYFATAYLVFLTIYTLGLRIDILTTAFDLVEEHIPFLYWYGIMIGGCGLLGVWMIFVARKKLMRSDIYLLAGLLLWMAFSAFMNRDLGFKDNLTGVVAIGVTVVAFYLIGRTFSREDMNFVIKRVVLWGSVIWNIGCVISLGMYLANYWGYYKFGGFIRRSRQGIMEGRLFGDFSDPNYAAMISVLLIAGLYYVYRIMVPDSVKTLFARLARMYILMSMVLAVLYVSLSGSRSTIIAILGAAVVMTVLLIYRKRKDHEESALTGESSEAEPAVKKEKKDVFDLIEKAAPIYGKPVRTYGVRLLLVLATLAILYFGLPFGMQRIGAIITPSRDVEKELERDDVDMDNISNNRFDIWEEYVTLVKDRPLWGFSTRGALPYIRETNPDAYIAQKGYNPHSMFVQMLVQGGAVGFLLMLLFLIRALVKTWKRCVKKKPLSELFLLGLFWVLIHGSFCVFNVGIFITPCLEAMLAWIGLGYLEQESEDVAAE